MARRSEKKAYVRCVNSLEANFFSLSLPPPLFSHPFFTIQHHTTSVFSFLNFAVVLSAVASLHPPPHPPRLLLNTNDQQQEAGKRERLRRSRHGHVAG